MAEEGAGAVHFGGGGPPEESPAQGGEGEVVVDVIKCEGVELAWRDVCFAVPSLGGPKHILSGVSGLVSPGEVLFILGPSGSGKTTLLDSMADRIKLTSGMSGGMTVNGEPKDELRFKEVSKYVLQQDFLSPAQTVEQTLCTSAAFYTRNKEDVRHRAAKAMEIMGITAQKDVRVGGVFTRGLSGGQLRRLSVANELVARSGLLFLDEPTSGLDSASAYNVVKGLRDVAKHCGATVLMTIHQPAEVILSMADKVHVMSSGRTAYFGPTDGLIAHFEKVTHSKIPPLTNRAEWVLELVDVSFHDEGHVRPILDAWGDSEACRELDRALAPLDAALAESRERGFRLSRRLGPKLPTPFYWQVAVLSERQLVSTLRNPGLYLIRALMYLGLCIFIGLIWLQLEETVEDIQDTVSVLFFVAAFLVFMSISVLPAFIEERAIFTKERANGSYSVLAYALAHFLVETPFLFLLTTVCALVTYFMIGLHGFWWYTFTLFCSFLVAESLMTLLAVALPSFILGIAAGAVVYGCFMTVQGYFRSVDSITWVLRWMHWISLHSFAFGSFIQNEFAGREYTCDPEAGTSSVFGCPPSGVVPGEAVIEQYADFTDLGTNAGVLLAMAAIYRCIGVVLMWLLHTGKK